MKTMPYLYFLDSIFEKVSNSNYLMVFMCKAGKSVICSHKLKWESLGTLVGFSLPIGN
jgi:hypothetical protein